MKLKDGHTEVKAPSLTRRYWPVFGWPFTLTVVLVALEAACDVLQPTILARLLDEGVRQGRLDLVLTDAAWMLLVAGIGALFALSRNYFASHISLSCAARIRSDLFRKIVSRPVDKAALDDPDSLLTRLTNDITQVQNFLNGAMRIFFKAPLLAVGAILMASLLDPGLAALLLVIVPLVLGILAFTIGRGFGLFRHVQEQMDRLNTVFREFLTGVRVIKALERGSDEEQRFAKAAGNLAEVNTRAQWFMTRVGPMVALLVNLGIVAVLWLGLQSAEAGDFRPGHLIAFVNYMTQILFALMMATNIINSLVRARASASRISEVLNAPGQENPDTEREETDLPHQAAGLEFHRVSFRWPGGTGDVIRDVSFRIEAGEFIGIVGSTGSGKSSLVQLACGFQHPHGGSISRPARSHIAVVPQRVNLFSGTIRSNLLWGHPNADQAQLEQAAEAAGAKEFIDGFPDGWETRVGRGGVTLSGGQKQRLSLARALLRQPGLLILDDSTSAVDSLTEAAIRTALRALPGKPTIVLVAQRIASVAQADRVLVLDEGRLIDLGTHRELSVRCEIYRDIIRSQTGWEADHV